MPNKLFKPKGVKERKSSSIADYNSEHGTKYLIFAMRDVTDMKSETGYGGDGKPVYLKEFFSIMFGNHELTEYVLLDPSVFDEAAIDGAKRVKVGNCELSYTYRKGAFSRRHYNARFEYDGVQYYVYLKTCNDVKFSQLMTEFFEGKLY